MIIIYHANCIDGFCSAWVAHKVHKDAKFIPMQYQMPFDSSIVEGEDVLIFDFSFEAKLMEELIDKANSLKCFDHHETAKYNLFAMPGCVFDLSRAGCQMAWDYFFPERRRPWLVDYVADRDLWKWELDNSKELNAYIGTLSFNFDEWDAPHSKRVALGKGQTLLKYQDILIRAQAKNARLAKFEGFDVAVVSCATLISEVGHALLDDFNVDIAIMYFQTKEGDTVYSLRGNGTVHLGELSQKFGGGGHRDAAGFKIASHEPHLF